jgi:hypothetical protein
MTLMLAGRMLQGRHTSAGRVRARSRGCCFCGCFRYFVSFAANVVMATLVFVSCADATTTPTPAR